MSLARVQGSGVVVQVSGDYRYGQTSETEPRTFLVGVRHPNHKTWFVYLDIYTPNVNVHNTTIAFCS